MHTLTIKVTLAKDSQRRLQAKAMANATREVLEMFNTRQQRTSGWELTAAEPTWTHTQDRDTGNYHNQEHLLLTYSHAAHQHRPLDVARLLAKLASNCQNNKCGRMTLTHVDGALYAPSEDVTDAAEMYDAVGYANCTIPEDWDSHFTHLYGLESHIERVRRALEEGDKSGWVNRFSAVLYGPPGCGKSDIASCVGDALGEDAVVRYSATETTGAGGIKDIVERDVLPRVIIIEEIEKADPKALDWLLAILDIRGEVRKVTARENVQRDAKLFAICTVNDMELFRSMRAGALASRFVTKVAFKRPSREVLAKILTRELTKVGGNLAWIDPCLDFCESIDLTDPREVTAHCLCGRDEWMDGSYAKMVAETSEYTETVLANATRVSVEGEVQ
jgi:hypothetical protein